MLRGRPKSTVRLEDVGVQLMEDGLNRLSCFREKHQNQGHSTPRPNIAFTRITLPGNACSIAGDIVDPPLPPLETVTIVMLKSLPTSLSWLAWKCPFRIIIGSQGKSEQTANKRAMF